MQGRGSRSPRGSAAPSAGAPGRGACCSRSRSPRRPCGCWSRRRWSAGRAARRRSAWGSCPWPPLVAGGCAAALAACWAWLAACAVVVARRRPAGRAAHRRTAPPPGARPALRPDGPALSAPGSHARPRRPRRRGGHRAGIRRRRRRAARRRPSVPSAAAHRASAASACPRARRPRPGRHPTRTARRGAARRTVRPGDSLWSIARAAPAGGRAGRRRGGRAGDRSPPPTRTGSADPDLIFPGTVLRVPPLDGTRRSTHQEGSTIVTGPDNPNQALRRPPRPAPVHGGRHPARSGPRPGDDRPGAAGGGAGHPRARPRAGHAGPACPRRRSTRFPTTRPRPGAGPHGGGGAGLGGTVRPGGRGGDRRGPAGDAAAALDHARVYADLDRRVRIMAQNRPAGQRMRTIRPQVRSVHVCQPAPTSAEVSVHVRYGQRSRALAARLEQRNGHWTCTALLVG